MHKNCCFIEEKNPGIQALQKYADYLKRELNTGQFIAALQENPEIAADYRDNVEILADFRGLSPKLHRFTLKDKPLIESYLQKSNISANHFAGIFIWKGLFRIFWTLIEEHLCIFYQDNIGMFMALPPQGRADANVVRRCFELMAVYNQNSDVSRIENVPEGDSEFYSKLGFKARLKDKEYLCPREDLAKLSGAAFKHKRAGCNHFTKNYNARFLEYKPSMSVGCLKLYRRWMALRKAKFSDCVYRQMLTDNFAALKTALKFYQELGLRGYVVKVEGEIKGCSFGYPLNEETFCILFEVCDLGLKGIAQFIFREFSRILSGYKYVNIMGSSDLENLTRVKLSYRPEKEVKVYNIYGQENRFQR